MFIWLTGLEFQLVAFNVLPLHQLSPAHIFPDGFCHELWAGYKKQKAPRGTDGGGGGRSLRELIDEKFLDVRQFQIE